MLSIRRTKETLEEWGVCEVIDNVYIKTSEYIMAYQENWDDDNKLKYEDFSLYEYYIFAGRAKPTGFDDLNEAYESIMKPIREYK